MNSFSDIVFFFIGFIEILIPIVAGIALLVFFWGLTRFIMKAGDTSAVKEGRDLMVWGTIALFVMVSVWGILRFVQSDLGIGNRHYGGFVIPLLPN